MVSEPEPNHTRPEPNRTRPEPNRIEKLKRRKMKN